MIACSTIATIAGTVINGYNGGSIAGTHAQLNYPMATVDGQAPGWCCLAKGLSCGDCVQYLLTYREKNQEWGLSSGESRPAPVGSDRAFRR